MSHEQQILTNLAKAQIDLGKQFLATGETAMAKLQLRKAIEKIDMIDGLATHHQEQNGSTAVLEIEATKTTT